jgi:hypothetical protein
MVFVIQGFLFVFYNGDNWYIEVGHLALPIDEYFRMNSSFTFDDLFHVTNSHIHFFPRLVLWSSLVLNDYDTKNVMYFGLIIISASLFVFYKILNRINKNLLWCLIPIAALLFNPIQYTALLWAFGSMDWFIPIFGLIGVVYLLNKTRVGAISFIFALCLGIISSFSLVLGTMIFVSGIFVLLIKKDWKKSSIWILFTIIIFSTFYMMSEEGDVSDIEIIDNPEFSFLKILSIPFVLKYDLLYLIAGGIIITAFFSSLVIHKTKIKKYSLSPFIQLSFVSIVSGLIISLFRLPSYYYAPFANIGIISLTILLALIIVSLKPTNNKKRFLIIILYVLIISQLFLLIPSYYMGWKLGTEFSEEKSAISSCFAINKNNVQLCEEDRFNLYDDFELLNSMNEMKNREIGIFINDGTVDKNNKMEIKLFDDKYTNSISDDGFGMIEYVNDEKILDDKLVNVDTPLVTITGWISYDEKIIDSVYVLSNNEIISKILNFEETNEKDQYSKEKYFWSTKILTSYLENECNEISFVGIQNENKITINEKITICKKN